MCGDTNVSIRRQAPILLSLSLAAVALFFVATVMVGRYRSSEARMAAEWYRKAEAAFSQGRFAEAIGDYRSALLYARGDSRYRLRLAAALAASGEIDQARSYLVELWEEEPGDGVVNRELARLAAAQGDVQLARRYYSAAIYGAWGETPAVNRRQARLELAEFLLHHGSKAEASAELIALATDLPRDASAHLRVAALFEQASEPARALMEYRRALAIDSHALAALKGAGRAAFAARDYLSAQRYLREAVRAAPDDSEAKALLDGAEDVLRIDPFLRRLAAAERVRRATQAFAVARARLEECSRKLEESSPAAADAAALSVRAGDLDSRIRRAGLARDPDAVEEIMDLVFEIERAAAGACGAPAGLDGALLQLAGDQPRAEP